MKRSMAQLVLSLCWTRNCPKIQPQRSHASVGVEILGPEAANRAQHSLKMAQQRPNIASKWPNISPKSTHYSTSTEPCFGWGWNFRPESRQQPNIDSPKMAQHSLLCWAYVWSKKRALLRPKSAPKRAPLFLGHVRARYEGVAPSTWAFAAWFWQVSGSWAMYVPTKQLDSMLRKKYGEKPAQKIAKHMSFLGT